MSLLAPITPNDSEQEETSRLLLFVVRQACHPIADFTEKGKCSLATGRLADLAVLSQNIFSAAPGELPKTVSVLTLVCGRIAHNTGVLENLVLRRLLIGEGGTSALVLMTLG